VGHGVASAGRSDLFIHADPLAFIPVKGAWGKQGATNVRLSKAKKNW
jgi:hypothetical protein